MKNMTGAIYVAGALDYETRKRVSWHSRSDDVTCFSFSLFHAQALQCRPSATTPSCCSVAAEVDRSPLHGGKIGTTTAHFADVKTLKSLS